MNAVSQIEPLVVPAGEGPFVELGDHRAHIKVTAQASNGELVLAETKVDFRGGVPPHVHTREDETFYIQEGRFDVRVGDRKIEAGPGDTVFAPRNVPHAWNCVSEGGGQVLVLITPGANFEAFAIRMAQRGYVPSAAMEDPATLAEFMALAEQHGIQMLPNK
ncbi:MAG: cupin domain-containing protein [Armatimonadetes bacterium]|nr:cupin domain-containing protein [Armatimonadota bacterium]